MTHPLALEKRKAIGIHHDPTLPHPTPVEGELARVGKGVRPRKAFPSSWTISIVCKPSSPLINGRAIREQDWTKASFFSAFLGTSFPKEIETRCSLSQNKASQSTPGKGRQFSDQYRPGEGQPGLPRLLCLLVTSSACSFLRRALRCQPLGRRAGLVCCFCWS